jgi:cellulose synthase/poly-beta-1,6-N-acetylglucosamine synthase-like glycosyltransferase
MYEERQPFVSIIVPVYNGERNIGNCIESLLALNYPSSKMEIIIVDNNSKDATYKTIQKYPVIPLIEDKIQSSYASRNAGLKIAKGEIIAFTDSDCIADKEWILKALECFQDNSVGCVAGRIEGYSPSNYIEEYLVRTRALCQGSTRFLPYAQTANALYRKDVFDSIGLFEEKWISGGDADLTWRMLLHSGYKIVSCSDSVIYHVHRSTLKGFFKQRMTWGYGEVLLHKKYKAHYQRREWEIVRDYKEYFRIVLGRFFSMLSQRFISKDEKAFQDNKLTLIAVTGQRLGRIKGSILEKEFYI